MSDQGDVSVSDCSGPCQPSPQLQLYQTIIFATPVLFAFLLLVLFCMLYIRRRRNANISSQARVQFVTRGFFPTPMYDNGLSKSFRQRLPTVPFDEQYAASNEDNQCAVCLGDYQLNEKLQQLPLCKHSFHVPCIDEWLAKNTTCPICRTSLLQGGNSMKISVRPEDNRHWEERVINEAQDGLVHTRPDASNGASSSISAVTSSENAHRFSIDHSINIERS
eukprot:c9916_g1_i2 orf=661-1323(+)